MDQNSETPQSEPQNQSEELPIEGAASPGAAEEPFEWTPITFDSNTPAAEQVVDVQAQPGGEPTSSTLPPTFGQPLQPEVIGAAYQAPKKSNTGWIIAIIVLVVLCCCCLVLLIPFLFMGRLLGDILGGVYYVIIDMLNNMFGSWIQFY